ncbi:MAG: hypothetical protein JSR46_04915 [Verrucomicrobia bacterium]|nr:hypothetical protein [Verrucomicrobiota bacterium]
MGEPLTTFHYPLKSQACRAADFFYTPARKLFGGRDVYAVPTLHQGQFSLKFEEYASSTESDWLETARDMVLLVPGLLLGAICHLLGANENHQWVTSQYQNAPKEQQAQRPAKNVYFTVDDRISSSEANPVHWDAIKKRYAPDAKVHQIDYYRLRQPLDTEENDLYLVFKPHTHNLFLPDSHFAGHAGKRTAQNPIGFLDSKGIQNKTIIFDYEGLERYRGVIQIKETMERLFGSNCIMRSFPELNQHTIEARCIDRPFWFK